MSELVVDRLVAGYTSAPIVQGASISVKSQHVLSVLGPNGAGKSTFLKAIVGLLHPTGGSVRLNDRELTNVPTNHLARMGLGYVPQETSVFPTLSVRENLEMGAYIRTDPIQATIDELLELFPDLKPVLRRPAGSLSGGQARMLAFARALMVHPEVLLLDEPTAGVAPAFAHAVWTKIRRIAETGTAVVVVEQNVDLALEYADAACIMVAGVDVLTGTAAEVAQEDLSSIFLGQEEVSPGRK